MSEPGFLAMAATSPDGLALTDGVERLSWGELADALVRRADVARRVIGPGHRVAVVGANAMETVLVYAGSLLAGVGVIPVSTHLNGDELAYIVKDGGASAIWSDSPHVGVATAAASQAGAIVLVGGGPLDGALDWNTAVAGSTGPPLDLDTPPGESMSYTSGTTGFPKGVLRRLSGAATVRDVVTAAGAHYATGLGPHLVSGPLYHSGPHACIGLLLNGTPVVVPPRFDPQNVMGLIGQFRVASSVMVPTHFVRLLALSDEVRATADVSSLQVIGQTGASCPVEVKRRMIDWFGPVFRESYGATESGILTVIDSEEWLRKPGSVGRTVGGIMVRVVDDAGHDLSAGVEGRLYFRSPDGRGIEYHGDPEKSAAVHLEPGVFTLGEVGYVDEDGYVFITDRFSDMVVSGGVNIYPAECERVLLLHPEVTDAAVFGLADAEMGERLVGAVTLCADALVTTDELKSFCRERLAHYKVPKELHVVGSLPRSAMGKLDKKALRRADWSVPGAAR